VGSAWAAPLIVVGAPAAHAGISQCKIDNTGVIVLGPNELRDVDAVCAANSQLPDLNVPRIRTQYGYAFLPAYIEICNCTTQSAWYRFRETDTLSEFQIEVDGRHNDQNATTAGYRPAFKLAPITTDAGSCQRFPVTYRTSATRPFSSGSTVPTAPGTFHSISFTTTLQINPSTSASPPAANDPGWVNSGASVTVTGKVWRRIRQSATNNSDPINFNSCLPQNGGTTTRIAEVNAGPAARPSDEARSGAGAD
jgi:hypothetical protein